MPIPILLFAGMVAVFLALLIIIHRVEKRLVWPYSEPQANPHFPETSSYAEYWAADAAHAGFSFLGWVRDIKGDKYRVDYALLISPDHTTLATIGSGFLMKMPVQGAWLHTPAIDGRLFYSTNQLAGVQIDMSRNWISQLAPEMTFATFWQRHREWLPQNAVIPRPLRSGHELEDFREIRELHFRAMERAGLIAYTDGSATQWHYTLYGSAITAIVGYFSGLMRTVTRGRFPRNV